jgi:shikimate kinase
MPLAFITGISTAGKSTAAKELSELGYETYDTEHDGMSAYFNKATHERAAGFNEAPERTEAWLSQHEWLIDEGKIASLQKKAEAENKIIFLCGGSENEPAIHVMCKWVIWLMTDEETIRKRVNNPRDHDYGTRPHELAIAIASNKKKEAEYRNNGAIIIDSRQSIHAVIEQILSATAEG